MRVSVSASHVTAFVTQPLNEGRGRGRGREEFECNCVSISMGASVNDVAAISQSVLQTKCFTSLSTSSTPLTLTMLGSLGIKSTVEVQPGDVISGSQRTAQHTSALISVDP